MHPHRPSAFKPWEAGSTGLADAALGTPASPVVALPVDHRPFKADVLAGFFGFEPLVAKDLFTLREEFGVERRTRRQIGVFVRCRLFLHSYLSLDRRGRFGKPVVTNRSRSGGEFPQDRERDRLEDPRGIAVRVADHDGDTVVAPLADGWVERDFPEQLGIQ